MSEVKTEKKSRSVFDTSFISHNTTKVRINDIALKCAGLFHKHVSNTKIEARFHLGTFKWLAEAMPQDLKQDWIQKGKGQDTPRYSRGNMSEVLLESFDDVLVSSQDYVFDNKIVAPAISNLKKLVLNSFKGLTDSFLIEREITLEEIYDDPSSDSKLYLVYKMTNDKGSVEIDDTHEVLCTRRRDIEHTDLLMPSAAYDIRLTFGIEEEMEKSRINTNQEVIPCREVDKIKYCCSLGSLCLSMVKSYNKGDKENTIVSFEAAFECSGLVLGKLDECFSTSLTGEYASLVDKVINAARETAYAASPINDFK